MNITQPSVPGCPLRLLQSLHLDTSTLLTLLIAPNAEKGIDLVGGRTVGSPVPCNGEGEYDSITDHCTR